MLTEKYLPKILMISCLVIVGFLFPAFVSASGGYELSPKLMQRLKFQALHSAQSKRACGKPVSELSQKEFDEIVISVGLGFSKKNFTPWGTDLNQYQIGSPTKVRSILDTERYAILPIAQKQMRLIGSGSIFDARQHAHFTWVEVARVIVDVIDMKVHSARWIR